MVQHAEAQLFRNYSKTVEADPNKEYLLTDENGPWLIHCFTFRDVLERKQAHSAPNQQFLTLGLESPGRKQANTLVYELRKNYKWKAFVYEKKFAHDLKNEDWQKQNPYNRRLKYQKSEAEVEYAVVIGDFQSIEDKDFQSTLKAVKQCKPQCLTQNKQPQSANRFFISGQAEKWGSVERNGQCPLSLAFGFYNPLLPPEMRKGKVDKFVASINVNRPYSLLNCPRKFTVQIATFTGKVVIKPDEVEAIKSGKNVFYKPNQMSELEIGERAAVKLCRALREQGVEAYEFHERYGSIVTVGSFDIAGQQLPNGMTELHPQVLKVINYFQGKPVAGVGGGNMLPYRPVVIDGIECDIQPRIIEVPRP